MTIYNFIKRIISFSLSWLVLLLNAAETPKENFFEPVSTQTFVLTDALRRAQGITTDGTYYYFSSNIGLLKTELDGVTVVKQNTLAIPYELLKLGCKHIGGISYYNGKIYAPVEDSKVFENLYICTFDSQTLELIDYYALPLETQENGVPWCVANPDEGVIYTARRDYPEELNVYDAESLELIGKIPLSETPHKVQGGEMHNGILYLSVSRNEQSVFAVNPKTGQVQVAFERNLPEGSEGEGMTVFAAEDGSLFHVMDICSVRLGTHLRHYAFDPDSLVWD
ncbi:MAG: hypothetical protein ACI4JG_07590 [Acutalibacteraceae bacterium]